MTVVDIITILIAKGLIVLACSALLWLVAWLIGCALTGIVRETKNMPLFLEFLKWKKLRPVDQEDAPQVSTSRGAPE